MQRYFGKMDNSNNVILNSDDIYHITKVMRMKNNDYIEIVIDNKLYKCEIINIKNNIEFKIIEEILIKEDNMPYVILILPLLKEQKTDLILQKSTELGVSEIIFINTERSIIKLDDNKLDKKLERWRKICKEASEQSKRIDIPKIKFLKNKFELKNLEGVKYICSTISDNKLKMCLKKEGKYDKICIVVGPEGGFSIKEEKEFNALGFSSVNFGSRIMRVETVPIFLLSIINYEYME